MNALTFLAAVAVILGGLALAVQAPINAVAARALGNDPLLAACLSFAVGFAALAALAVARSPWPALDGPALPWWAWTGGLLGAFYVAAVIWSVPQLGVVTTVAALVLGQMAGALALDAVGAFGLPVHAVTWTRLVGVGLVLAGLILSRVG